MMGSVTVMMAMCAAALGAPWQPEQFPIGYWLGPPPEANSLQTWQTVADCNFTFTGPRGGYSVEENLEMLDFCQQAGVRALVTDSRIHWQMTANEGWEETVAEIIADYASHPALYGYYLKDEPNHQLFAPLGEMSREFERQDPDHLPYINLFPTYANVRQLGTPTYADHIAKFLETVQPRVLSYDHYALLRAGGMRPDYYENLAIIRDLGLQHNTPQWQIILSLAHLAYRDPTEAEMRWQVYTSLAYGMKGIMYFTYWTPPSLAQEGRYGIVDGEGRPARLYPIVQQLNSEIRALGATLLGLTSTEVYHTGEQIPAGATRQGTDAVVRVPEELPLLVGMFEDKAGELYAMIVNRDWENPVELQANMATHVAGVAEVSAENGSEAELEMTDGAVPLELPAGGGRLLHLSTEFDYPQPPRPRTEISFQFDDGGDLEGWSPGHSLGSAVVRDGVLTMAITGDDPYMTRSFLRLPPDAVSVVRVRMRITSGNDEGQLFWGTAAEPGFSDQRYLNFAIQPDGEWHEYEVPVGEHPKWRGQKVQAVRLDPTTGGAEEGARVEIDWIVGE